MSMPLVESAYAKKAAVKIEPNIVKKSATRHGYTFFAIACRVAGTRTDRVTGAEHATGGLSQRAPLARAPAAIRTSRCASVSGWYSESPTLMPMQPEPRRLFSLGGRGARAARDSIVSAVRPAGGGRCPPAALPAVVAALCAENHPAGAESSADAPSCSSPHESSGAVITSSPEFASPKSRDDVGRRSAAADDGTSLPLDAAAVLSGAPSPSVSAMTGTIHAWRERRREDDSVGEGRARRAAEREKRERRRARRAASREAAHLGGEERVLGVVVRRLVAVVAEHALGVLARAVALARARGARVRALVRVLVREHVLDVRHLHEQRPRDHADHDERRDQHEEDVERREARRAADREQVAREDRDDLGRAEAGLERRDRRRRDHRREHARGAVQHPRRHAEQQHERDHEPPLEEQRRHQQHDGEHAEERELAAEEVHARRAVPHVEERVVLPWNKLRVCQ